MITIASKGRGDMGAEMEGVNSVVTVDCPYCSEPINPKSKKCKHCGEILDAQMRDLEMLKRHGNAPNVFMNSGGGGGAASGSSTTSAEGALQRFPHWMHILLTLFTGALWLPVYLLMFWFRDRRRYF